MKHLRKFNEEISSGIYRKAGRQLRELGHQERGARLISHSYIEIKKKVLVESEKLRKKYAQFGTLGVTIPDGLADYDFEDNGNFNFIIIFDKDMTVEQYDTEDDFREYINLYFHLLLIPTEKYINHLFDDYKGDDAEFLMDDLELGYHNINTFTIDFKVGIDHFNLSGIDIFDGEYGSVKFSSRKEAKKFKSTLANIFGRRIHYLSINSYKNDETSHIENAFSELDILIDYGMDPKDVSKLIDKLNINKLKWTI